MNAALAAREGSVAGIDGCRGGWIGLRWEPDGSASALLHGDFAELCARLADCERILVDMPIGLPTRQHPVRACDREARRRLGWPRSASIFSPPCAEAAGAPDYAAALRANRAVLGRGLSRQAYHLGSKILEVAGSLPSPGAGRTLPRESHPELCWRALFPGRLLASKHDREGLAARIHLLRPFLGSLEALRPRQVAGIASGWADLADAAVLAVAARAECEEIGGPGAEGHPTLLVPRWAPGHGG